MELTNHLGLGKPAVGEAGWGAALNQNFDKLDAAAAKTPVRQTVLTGRTSPEGYANFLEAGAGLSVVMKASTPVVVSFAAGFGDLGPVDVFAKLTNDMAWNGLEPNATSYLFVETESGVVSAGTSSLKPYYGDNEPSSFDTNAVPQMAATTNGGVTISDNGSVDAAHMGWKAFDRSGLGDYFYSNSATNAILTIDFGAGNAKNLKRYTLKPYETSGIRQHDPKAWTFEGSDDGQAWTILDTRTGNSFVSHTEKKTFDFWSDTAYRFYRLKITETFGGASAIVSEMEVFSPTTPAGKHWFDLNAFQMKVWSGTAWQPKKRVFVGEAVTGADSATSVTTYALRGRYDSGWFALSASTTHVKIHNLGFDTPALKSIKTRKIDGTGSVFESHYYTYGGYGYGALCEGFEDRKTFKVVTDTYPYPGVNPLASGQGRVILERGW